MANYLLTKSTNTASGVNPTPGAGTNTTIVSAGDSGNIKSIAQPGGSQVKLTDTTQQSATTAKADSTVPGLGNCLNGSGEGATVVTGTYGPAGNSLGYSILGE